MLHGQTRMRAIQILEHKPITQQKLSLHNEDASNSVLILVVTISNKKRDLKLNIVESAICKKLSIVLGFHVPSVLERAKKLHSLRYFAQNCSVTLSKSGIKVCGNKWFPFLV